MGYKTSVRIIRINPDNQTIVAMTMKTDTKSLRAKLGARHADELGEEKFMVGGGRYSMFAKMAQPVGLKGFRIRGMSDDTSGVAVISKRGDKANGLIDCDIILDSLKREIIWVAECRGRKPKPKPIPDPSTTEGN